MRTEFVLALLCESISTHSLTASETRMTCITHGHAHWDPRSHPFHKERRHLHMKKSCIAIAALCAVAGTAGAQSNVTIYGVLDLSIAKTNNGRSFLNGLPVGLTGQPDTWNLRPSTSNRIGFRGTEDLGGGMRASFNIEHRLDPSQGSEQNGQNGMWRGQSWVGLGSSSLGEIRLGRQFNPALYVAQNGDPWSWDYNVGSVQVINRAGNGSTYAANAITYITPNMSGVTAQLQVGLGEGGTAANPLNNTDRQLGANIVYNKSGLYLGAAYNDVRIKNSPNQNRFVVLTGHYDFGPIRPILQYAQGKNVSTAYSRSFLVGATAPVGLGRLKMVAAQLDPAGADNTTRKFGLGYEYFLSKRTSVHADVGTGKTTNLSRTTGFEAGIKHVF